MFGCLCSAAFKRTFDDTHMGPALASCGIMGPVVRGHACGIEYMVVIVYMLSMLQDIVGKYIVR